MREINNVLGTKNAEHAAVSSERQLAYQELGCTHVNLHTLVVLSMESNIFVCSSISCIGVDIQKHCWEQAVGGYNQFLF